MANKEAKKAIHENWKVWTILIIVAISIVGIKIFEEITEVASKDTTTITAETSNSKSESMTETEYYNKNIKLKENPYKVNNEYDGVYEFSLNGEEGIEHKKINVNGFISFDNGVCKVRYLTNNTSSIKYNSEYTGFCGLNEKDNNNFYFTINYDKNNQLISYMCTRIENKILGNLKSYRDLIECENDKLELTYVQDANNIEKAITQIKEKEQKQKEAEEKAKKEQEERDFKESCNTYTYEQMARNPEKFKGTNVKLTGEVVQVMTDSYSTNLRVNITKKGNYSTYYTDTVYVVYYPQSGEDKILEKDIITIYGTSQGDCSYNTVMGATVTLPNISAKYITIEK